jgi:RNA polymerase sigma factor (sigma-70 family)
MAAPTAPLLRHIHRLIARPDADSAGDRALLDRFVTGRDESAFAALLARHGPMVLGVCRRVLHDAHEAEDAFQATFLVLARKAGMLRRPESLAAWLYGTARHLALKCHRRDARRRQRERDSRCTTPVSPPVDPLDELAARELLLVLDEEMERLPEAYRLPLILCGLEGRSQEEAARLLGWTPGSIRGRLERGRARLHERLTRRGLALSGALLTLEVSQAGATAAAMQRKTEILRSALNFAWGQHAGISTRVVTLAERAVREMAAAKMKRWLALLLAGLVAGTGVLAHPAPGTKQLPTQPGKEEPRPDRPAPSAGKLPKTDSFGDPLPPNAVARMGAIRFRHIKDVGSLAFSPDGKILVTGTWDNSPLILWDAATGRELRRIDENYPQPTKGVPVFAPDGKRLAAYGYGSPNGAQTNVRFWDVATGEELRPVKIGVPLAFSGRLAYSPDGKILAVPDDAKVIHLVDVASGTELRQLKGHPEKIASLAFSPDGKTLAAGGDSRTILLWKTDTGEQLRQLLGHEKEVPSVAFSADGKELASASRDGTVRLWDMATGVEQRRFTFEKGRNEWDAAVQTVLYVPGTRWLVAGGIGSIPIWDLDTGREVRRWHGHWGLILCPMAVSPDGKKLAATCEGGQVILRELATDQRLCEPEGHQRGIASVSFSPDGKTLATGSADNTLRLWDVTSGKERRRLSLPSCVHAAFSPDGKLLAGCCNEDEFIRIWDAATGEELRRFRAGKWNIWVTFTPDGQMLASAGGADNVIHLRRVDTGAEVRRFVGSQDRIMGIAFASDGRRLASIGWDKTARLWDVASGKEVRQFRGQQGELKSIAVSPDGKLVAAGEDNVIHLWDAATGAEVRRWEVGELLYPINALRFSPDGRVLASARQDRDYAIRLWEVATGRERLRFLGHRDGVGSLDFSPDGRRLASGGGDAIVLVWDVTGRSAAERAGDVSLTERERNRLWDELSNDKDAALAFRAMCLLLRDPAGTVRLIGEHLPPVSPVEEAQVARWLADLDNVQFTVREQAMRELARHGEAVESSLRKLLDGRPSLEVRQRVKLLLEKLEGANRLRMLRAVEVLEHIDTPEARQLLEKLAGGAAGAAQTREAKAALERLHRRPTARP